MGASSLESKPDYQDIAYGLSQKLGPLRNDILEANIEKKWAVMCSGGVDSVSLLYAIWAEYGERVGELTVVHFDHGQRVESGDDAEFVKGVAEGLGLPCVVGVAEDLEKGATETQMRGVRMDFLDEVMAELGIEVVLFGHQAEDVLETQLMRLMRGSGVEGLSAPRPVRELRGGGIFVRPHLGVKKAVLVNAMREVGADWVEDQSNAGGDFLRNRVRNEVVPMLEAVADRDVVKGALASRAMLEEESEALEWLGERAYGEVRVSSGLDLGRLMGMPKGVVRRVVQRYFNEMGVVIEKRLMEAVLGKVEGGGEFKVEVEVGRYFVGSGGICRIEGGK